MLIWPLVLFLLGTAAVWPKLLPLFASLPETGPAIVLFFLGLYAVTTKRSLARLLMGIIIIEFSAELFLVAAHETSSLTGLIGLAAVLVGMRLISKMADYDSSNMMELRG